jgi:hypothetical protein
VAPPEMRFSTLVRLTMNRRQKLKNALLLLFLAASLTYAAACNWESPTSVRVSYGPAFIFSGSGRLASFTVYAPHTGQRIASPNPDVATVVWQIRVSKGYFEGSHVERMQLSYGKLPDGYNQGVPSQSQRAPPLASGAVYSFFAETTDAPAIGGFFYMSETRPTQINVPDFCLRLINGRDVAVKCGTNEPYQEPTDLEKFAQQHRVTR